VKRYGKKASWIVKKSGKYGRKLWNDMENMEENSEQIWKTQKKIVKCIGIFPIFSLFTLLFFCIFQIFSLINLLFFHIFHIFSLFNFPFFHIVHILSLYSSIFSISFHNFLPHFTYLFTINLLFFCILYCVFRVTCWKKLARRERTFFLIFYFCFTLS
jgi:hypothetical protein